MQELYDLNAAQCEDDQLEALQECSEYLARLTTRLKDQINAPATYPRVGSLLAVRDALKDALGKVPMTETEKIEQASLRG